MASDDGHLNQYWSEPPERLQVALHSTANGLTTANAQQRVAQFGPNVLEAKERATSLKLFLGQFKSPIVLILLFATGVSAATQEWIDAVIILAIVLGSALLSFFQEYSANTAAEKLRAQVTIKTTVLRDGQPQSIPAREVVPGDVVLLSAGSLVPADGVLLEARDFYVNQAVLTGETFPVTKTLDPVPVETSLSERTNKDLWRLHQELKGLLLAQIDKQARVRWQQDKVAACNVIAFGALLDPQILTLGFARRFTGYKRPDLILTDLERLKRLLADPLRPVQIIFAGKAHPADLDGKRLIQKVFRVAQDPEFAGRVAFVENDDHQLAEYLVPGVDVWLNNPLPPLEASGTSGMKAAINGTSTLSILDGWWIEGYNTDNGWAFGEAEVDGDRTQVDAEALYRLLEEEVIPLYYQRSDDQVPNGFVQVMKAAIKSVAPAFSARRMVKEYAERFYVRALGAADS